MAILNMRTTLVCSTAALLAMVPAAANAQQRTFDLPAQAATKSIPEFARQAGVQIIAPGRKLRTVMTRAIKGQHDVRAALNALLLGTGLRIVADDGRTITIGVEAAPPRAPGPRAVTIGAVERKAPGGSTAASTGTDYGASAGTPDILVQGRQTVNVDIKRTRDDVQPYQVFTAEQIQASNAQDLNEFLRTRLPTNAILSTNAQSSGSASGATSAINLRGLGTTQTLILLDGRRLPEIGDRGSFRQADINGIPLASIERIEILPSTASGIYGGGATGGVINIITKKDYKGLDLTADFGSSFRGDARNFGLSASGGASLQDGRTHIVFGGSYRKSDPLYLNDRDFLADARQLQFRTNPSAFYSLSPPPLGYSTNIVSQTGTNLVLKNGTALNSPRTYVPIGYAGIASDGGAALAANAGKYDLALPDTVGGGRQNLLPENRVSSLSFNVRHVFSHVFEAYADVAWFRNDAVSNYAGVGSSVTLPATSPANPFTTPIVVSYPATHLNDTFDNRVTDLRAMGGVIAHISRSWSATADYAWSKSINSFRFTYPITGDPDGAGPGLSDVQAITNGTLDVLRDLNAFPIDWTPYLLPTNDERYRTSTELGDATFRVSGTLIHLPGGNMAVSGSVERRRQELGANFFDTSTFTTYYPSASQTVMSYYAETHIPIFSPSNMLGFIRDLELQASVRRDDYSTRAPTPSSATVPASHSPLPTPSYVDNKVGATKFTVGMKYAPTSDIAFRASYGTGFLAPSILQIVPTAPIQNTLTIVDPKRGNVSATIGPITQEQGGNPNLQPESSKSLSVGAILTPRFLPGARLSIDYTRISKHNEISTLTDQDFFDYEDILPGRIVRAPLTADDIAHGYTGGVVQSINVTYLNFAKTVVQAYDFQADYTVQSRTLGQFHFYTIATWEPHFKRQTLLAGSFMDSVGFSGGPLEWRGNGGIDWKKGPWSFGWNAQFYDSYAPYAATSSAAVAAATIQNQGATRIPSQLYFDLNAGYTMPFGALRGTEIAIGIQNIFDRRPPLLATTGVMASTAAGYSQLADPRLRRFTLSVHQHF